MASRNLASHLVGPDASQLPQKDDNRAVRIVEQQKASVTPVATEKDTPYAIQVSQTRRKPACPYHTPIVDFNSQRTSTSEMTPMERFLCASHSEHPVTLCEGLRTGTAASGGCICGQALERQCTAML